MDYDSSNEKPWQAVRTEAVESLLVELGVIDSARVDEIVRHYEEKVGLPTSCFGETSMNSTLDGSTNSKPSPLRQ